MPAASLPLPLSARHQLARSVAALCYVYEDGDIGAAVARFKAHHPLLVAAAARRLDKFVAYWGRAGFDEHGRVRAAPPHGRPRILSKKDAQRAADAVTGGTWMNGILRRFRTLGQAFCQSPVLRRLLRQKQGNLEKPVSPSTVVASIHRVGPPIRKLRPERVPLLSVRQKAVRVAQAKLLLSKPDNYIKKMVFWDHVTLGVADAGQKDAVWAAAGLGRPVEESKLYAKGAKFRAAGCLCGVSYHKGTIGPFMNAPPGKYKVRNYPTFQTWGCTSKRACCLGGPPSGPGSP